LMVWDNSKLINYGFSMWLSRKRNCGQFQFQSSVYSCLYCWQGFFFSLAVGPLANLTKTTLKSRKLLSFKEENYSYRSTEVNRSVLVWFMVFNVTFNIISVISWQSVLLVEETRGPGENHRPVTSDILKIKTHSY
jgi:hypothetical protein